ncbi:hypothetical protein GQ44DRAFT_608694 [Phaeosphaeriaceae sp. PMI808]|nr:hypothetical protein GQ44DRAFT_608694 [Phaeosphaeriaceae sp. PMI808]
MHLLRVTSSRFICNVCQEAAIRSSSLLPLNGFITRASPRAITTPRKLSACTFTTSGSISKERDNSLVEDPDLDSLDHGMEVTSSITGNAESIAPAQISHPSQQPSVPWYLRQDSSARDQVQKPADIPDLPSNPPPLLNTILEYIAITAGLDDLQLLDLRHLDPPPALGPKLIMIIGTARSEKHLHVAADRFARWLRRDHGLKANAAGLLGRNELKIKLRRKAKRMRMLANVGGAVPEGNIDDGIRTGWICCTLSKIEAHLDDMHMPGDNVQEFVGFRDVKPGVNVVVQMFTEEKRAEIDLETLWGGVIRTHQRQLKIADDKLKEMEEPITEAELGTSGAGSATPIPKRGSFEPSNPMLPMRRPQPTPGDFFPSVSDSDAVPLLRRLHTVGLR